VSIRAIAVVTVVAMIVAAALFHYAFGRRGRGDDDE
jgi:hypothetical protein